MVYVSVSLFGKDTVGVRYPACPCDLDFSTGWEGGFLPELSSLCVQRGVMRHLRIDSVTKELLVLPVRGHIGK